MSSTNMIKIVPGDTLVMRIPRSQPKQSTTCSVRVLDKKSRKEDNFVCQVMDVVVLSRGPSQIVPGEIVELPKSHIISVIPSTINGISSELTLEIASGTITGLWRTDGKTEPINVRIIDRDIELDQVFKVDAVSSESLTHSSDHEELPMFPDMENA